MCTSLNRLFDFVTCLDEKALRDEKLLNALIEADLLEPLNDVIMRKYECNRNTSLGVH